MKVFKLLRVGGGVRLDRGVLSSTLAFVSNIVDYIVPFNIMNDSVELCE